LRTIDDKCPGVTYDLSEGLSDSDESPERYPRKPVRSYKTRRVYPSQNKEEMKEVQKAYAEQQYLKAKYPDGKSCI
jgi:hypothetical protein